LSQASPFTLRSSCARSPGTLVIDQVEDVLQASLPKFVTAVRVADVGQGTNPLRVVAMRALPDMPGHAGYPREEWVGLDQDTQSKLRAEEAAKGQAKSGDPAKDKPDEDTEQTGEYLNYEGTSFASSRAAPVLMVCGG
jgi:hypothetical protein